MIKIDFEPERLAALVQLVTAAGSRLGDGEAMIAAAEMVVWLRRQEAAAKAAAEKPAPASCETMPGGMTVACPAAHMNGHAT